MSLNISFRGTTAVLNAPINEVQLYEMPIRETPLENLAKDMEPGDLFSYDEKPDQVGLCGAGLYMLNKSLSDN